MADRRHSALRATGAEIVRGDLTNPSSLDDAACRGADTVLTTASAVVRRLEGLSTATIRQVDEDRAAPLARAAESAGVGRFVYLSSPIASNAPDRVRALSLPLPAGGRRGASSCFPHR